MEKLTNLVALVLTTLMIAAVLHVAPTTEHTIKASFDSATFDRSPAVVK